MTEYLKGLNTAQVEAVTFGVSGNSTIGNPLGYGLKMLMLP